jgi:hypothetical protein
MPWKQLSKELHMTLEKCRKNLPGVTQQTALRELSNDPNKYEIGATCEWAQT